MIKNPILLSHPMYKYTPGEPIERVEGNYVTLRDYFAGQAINSQALGSVLAVIKTDGVVGSRKDEELAAMAYGIADEMLKERMKYEQDQKVD